MKRSIPLLPVLPALLFVILAPDAVADVKKKVQGSSILVNISNISLISADTGSIAVQYPAGDSAFHLGGYGLWVGGLLDTSASGTMPPLRLVTTGNEGWAGPLYEFQPGQMTADTIWEASITDPQEPPGWSDYWGTDLPFGPLSDQDFYCRYDDFTLPVSGSVPLNLTVVQSSYAWTSSTADGILIIEYRIFNEGVRTIDSAFVGFLIEKRENAMVKHRDADHLTYLEYEDPDITPAGIAVLSASIPPDSLQTTFQWYDGTRSPSPDPARYALISTGILADDEMVFDTNTRCVTTIGPLTIAPRSTETNPLVVAVAVVSGADNDALFKNVAEAREIYLNGGISVSVSDMPVHPRRTKLSQNYPNPFNAVSNFGFEISNLADVSLVVYDLLGREIATIVNEQLAPGTYRRQWDASGQPSGVYFYRFSAGNYVETKRLVLMK